MRKADYNLLADLIASQLKIVRKHNDKLSEFTLRVIANAFSENASVDRKAFLKACGIDAID